MIDSPNELTAVEAVRAMRAGRLSAANLREACVARIRKRDRIVRAWVVLDDEPGRGADIGAAGMDGCGSLHGIPVGVKDIIDCHGLPTGMGSPIYAGCRPAVDASCVALLRAAGATILGKTVTTELAFVKSNGTANPWNPSHSAGASSTGSAAAVADRMVPLALGTQTASSVTRPAAYCGVVGYKGSHGAFSLAGIKSFAPTLDCLGGFSRTVEDALLLRAALGATTYDLEQRPAAEMPATVGVYLEPLVERCDPETSDLVRGVVARLRRSGIETIDFDLGIELAELEEAHKAVMAYESARSYAAEWMQHRDRLSAPLRALLQEGWNCPHGRYAAALERSRDARRKFSEAFDGIDLLLTPSAPGVAPAGLDIIGDPICSRPWSLIGAATLTMPAGLGSAGLPLGVQFVVPRGADDELLRRCLALETFLPSPRWPDGTIGHRPAHDQE